MIPSARWPAILFGPKILGAAAAQARRAQEETHRAFAALYTARREIERVHEGLQRKRPGLARVVENAAGVVNHQVELALGREWFPEPPDESDEPLDWSAAELRELPSGEAVELLAEEIFTLAMALAAASEDVPRRWKPALRQCFGSLALVVARMEEATLAWSPDTAARGTA
jgi:hypothetical protein